MSSEWWSEASAIRTRGRELLFNFYCYLFSAKFRIATLWTKTPKGIVKKNENPRNCFLIYVFLFNWIFSHILCLTSYSIRIMCFSFSKYHQKLCAMIKFVRLKKFSDWLMMNRKHFIEFFWFYFPWEQFGPCWFRPSPKS